MAWRTRHSAVARATVAVVAGVGLLVACSSTTLRSGSSPAQRTSSTGPAPATGASTTAPIPSSTDSPSGPPRLPVSLLSLVATAEPGRWRSLGTDQWEVWVCHVPTDTTAAIYGRLPLRLDLHPQQLAALIGRDVTPYFDQLSHGQYHPTFVAGGEVQMAATDEPQACLDEAFGQAAPGTRGVLAIADAEHGGDQPGGFGTPGAECAAPPCQVGASHRGAYVGASDFHPDWGARPPMDLVEHELGHSLGWGHSGYDPAHPRVYASAIDVMSNSAAPRDVDPDRRDAPDTLALNRLLAGWMPLDDVVPVPATGATAVLSSSTGASGQRAMAATVDRSTFVVVELLTADGFDSHLPAAGVAVHLVDTDIVPLVPQPLVGKPPFDHLLTEGQSQVLSGWRISVAAGWAITVEPAR